MRITEVSPVFLLASGVASVRPLTGSLGCDTVQEAGFVMDSGVVAATAGLDTTSGCCCHHDYIYCTPKQSYFLFIHLPVTVAPAFCRQNFSKLLGAGEPSGLRPQLRKLR